MRCAGTGGREGDDAVSQTYRTRRFGVRASRRALPGRRAGRQRVAVSRVRRRFAELRPADQHLLRADRTAGAARGRIRRARRRREETRRHRRPAGTARARRSRRYDGPARERDRRLRARGARLAERLRLRRDRRDGEGDERPLHAVLHARSVQGVQRSAGSQPDRRHRRDDRARSEHELRPHFVRPSGHARGARGARRRRRDHVGERHLDQGPDRAGREFAPARQGRHRGRRHGGEAAHVRRSLDHARRRAASHGRLQDAARRRGLRLGHGVRSRNARGVRHRGGAAQRAGREGDDSRPSQRRRRLRQLGARHQLAVHRQQGAAHRGRARPARDDDRFRRQSVDRAARDAYSSISSPRRRRRSRRARCKTTASACSSARGRSARA